MDNESFKWHFMKKNMLTFLLLTTCFFVSGQKSDTIFVDDFRNNTTKEKASFFIVKDNYIQSKKANTWTQNKYYLTKELAESCPVILRLDTVPALPQRDGVCKEYYKNGSLKSLNTYKYGIFNGPFEEYYSNGKLKNRGRHENMFDLYVYNDIDSLGVDRLVNGNGSICRYDSTLNCICYYEVKDSVLTISFYIDKNYKDTVYK